MRCTTAILDMFRSKPETRDETEEKYLCPKFESLVQHLADQKGGSRFYSEVFTLKTQEGKHQFSSWKSKSFLNKEKRIEPNEEKNIER